MSSRVTPFFHDESITKAKDLVQPKEWLSRTMILTFTDQVFNRAKELAGNDTRFVIGKTPGIGAPAAAVYLEVVIAQGIERILFLGTCGGLLGTTRIGDIGSAAEALSSDGTSLHYAESTAKYLPNLDLHKKIEAPHEWTAWTTDAPYRETLLQIEEARNKGAAVVEMEAAAIFAVCKALKVPVAGLLIVSDEVNADGWKKGFNGEKLAQSIDRAFEILVRAI